MQSLWKSHPQSSPIYAPVALLSLVGIVSLYSIRLYEYMNTGSFSILLFIGLLMLGGALVIILSTQIGQSSVQVIHWLKLIYNIKTKTDITLVQFFKGIIATNTSEEYRILELDYEDELEQPVLHITFIGHNQVGVIKSQLSDLQEPDIQDMYVTSNDPESHGSKICTTCDQRQYTVGVPIYDSKEKTTALVYNVCESCVGSIMTQAKREAQGEYATELTLKTI